MRAMRTTSSRMRRPQGIPITSAILRWLVPPSPESGLAVLVGSVEHIS